MFKTIGERLAHALEIRQSNPNKVSVGTSIHATTIKNYLENKGKPDSLKLDKIADFLSISRGWLKTGEGEMDTNVETAANLRKELDEAKNKYIKKLEEMLAYYERYRED